ncbi:MAG: hypothetical protein ACFFB5_05685 [Promethearchaeota archaeon]
MSDFKDISIFLILVITSLLSLQTNSLASFSDAAPHSPAIHTVTSESYDLSISEVVTEVERTFQRNIVLSRVWDRLLLNMSVQNFGDPLDNVFLHVITNGAPIHATFHAVETVGLVQAFSYQFEIPQTLVMTLNHTQETELQLKILILLDHSVTWRTPSVNFAIQKAHLIALDLIQPLERSILPLSYANPQYQIQPVKYSFQRRNLLASPILYVHIPANMQLLCTLLVTLQGTGVDYLVVDEQTVYANEGGHSISMNFTITKTSEDQDISLSMSIAPDYEGLGGETRVFLSITVVGMLEPYSSPLVAAPVTAVLGAHPIPWLLMIPILAITLFGIPYYLVYQDHVTDKDNTLLDPKNQTKIK